MTPNNTPQISVDPQAKKKSDLIALGQNPNKNNTNPTASVDPTLLARLRNPSLVGEGRVMPPRLTGLFRIPPVYNLRILKTVSNSGTDFYLTWQTPETIKSGLISKYHIFAKNLSATNSVPTEICAVSSPPAIAHIGVTGGGKYIFSVQIELGSGMKSDITLSPTVVGTLLS